MKLGAIVGALLALATSAFGQTPPNLPSNTVWGNLTPVTAPSRAVTLAALQAALQGGERTIANTNYTVGSTTGDSSIRVFAYTSLSAARTISFLSAASYSPGTRIYVLDRSGSASGTNTISVVPNGADTINGSNSTRQVIASSYTIVMLETDGVSKWTVGTSIAWSNISGTPTTLGGYGIVDARKSLQASGSINYYVNGNSATTSAVTLTGTNVLHFAAGSTTTNAITAAGNNILHFSATPPTIYVGATITDTTASVIPSGTTVTAIGQTTVTLSANATGGGVGNGDTIKWSKAVFPVGQKISDTTNGTIPSGATISSIAIASDVAVTISGNVTTPGVGNGDTIQWEASCGTTGASTCAIGNDGNAGTSPSAPFLTAQKAVNTIIYNLDLGGFAATVNLAHGASGNYSFNCTSPVLGSAALNVLGDSTARTAVGIVAPALNAAVGPIKDLCTVIIQDMAFYDAPTSNAVQFIQVGTGNAGHVDFGGLTFNQLAIGTMVAATYSGGSITAFLPNNQINGNANVAFAASAGGQIDFASLNNSFTVANNLTWGTAFAQSIGGTYGGLVALGATGTFGNPSGHSGPRCLVTLGFMSFGGFDPNTLFPGGSNCVGAVQTGAIGIQTGSGIDYGASGNCYKSGGSSAALNTWGSCAAAGVPQNLLNTQTANYTIQTSDCGKTIQAGTGSTGLFTVTLPAVGGFATNCVLDVFNGDSLRGKILSGFPAPLASTPNNILWAGDTIQVGIVNGAWALLSTYARHRITAAATFFVDTTNGADTNDCLATTTGACKTIQAALNYIGTWDTNSQAVTVSVADGTYTAGVLLTGPFHGNGAVTLTGNTGTPANAIISTTSADAIKLQNGASLTVGGFKLQTATSGHAIFVNTGSFVTINAAMNFGTTVGNHLFAQLGGSISNSTADYTISGNASSHFASSFAGNLSVVLRTITLSGSPVFATGFANAKNGGVMSLNSDTFSGAAGATTPRFAVASGGNIFTNQTSGTYLPGTAAGTIASGGVIDSFGQPTMTGTCAANNQTGGSASGTFAANGACAGGTYIMTFGAAAPTGWACVANDQTTTTNTVRQNASTTTSATFLATTTNLDVVSFNCQYY